MRITVYGTAKPAGSKRAFVIGGKARITDANKNSAPWKAQVAQHAGAAMEREGAGLLDGPLRVVFRFFVARPKGHFKADGSLSAAGRRRPYPSVKPDVLKLARGVEDALSGVVYRDDAQIVDERLVKLYGVPERVEIEVVELSAEAAA